jgi:hypothetical protein
MNSIPKSWTTSNYRPLPFRLVPPRPASSTFILPVHCIPMIPVIVDGRQLPMMFA